LPEFAIADGILTLHNRSYGGRDERTLRVAKLRGSNHLSGEHSFRINSAGIRVFPDSTIHEVIEWDALPGERLGLGVPGSDHLLAGGLWRGSSTVAAGPLGVGKTMLDVRYLAEGIQAKAIHRGAWSARQPRHLARSLITESIDRGSAERRASDPLCVAAGAARSGIAVRHHGTHFSRRVRCVVIDSLNGLRDAALDATKFRSAVWNPVQHLQRHSVTGLLLQ
jgi:circadian clock protein KaiC